MSFTNSFIRSSTSPFSHVLGVRVEVGVGVRVQVRVRVRVRGSQDML